MQKLAEPCADRADAMQAGHCTAADDKLTFEIKFDGYRCIAVKLSKG
jgi:ATP-dependent DNA ligase